MNQQQTTRRIISFAASAGIVMTAMIGAGLLCYGKTSGEEPLTLAGYIVLGVAALDWAVWELLIKARLLKGGQNTRSTRQE